MSKHLWLPACLFSLSMSKHLWVARQKKKHRSIGRTPQRHPRQQGLQVHRDSSERLQDIKLTLCIQEAAAPSSSNMHSCCSMALRGFPSVSFCSIAMIQEAQQGLQVDTSFPPIPSRSRGETTMLGCLVPRLLLPPRRTECKHYKCSACKLPCRLHHGHQGR